MVNVVSSAYVHILKDCEGPPRLGPPCLNFVLLTHVTQTALPAIRAETLKGANSIDAGSSVLTGQQCTVIDVCRQSRGRVVQKWLLMSLFFIFQLDENK